MRRRFLSLLPCLAAILCAVSCIYDYAPVVDGSESVVVIEGDILIGGYTEVRVSRTKPLQTLFSEMTQDTWPEGTRAWVEASDGTRYDGEGSRIDTRSADPSLTYRLLVSSGGSTYVSEWTPVVRSAAIDSVSYSISDDGMSLTIDVSTSGDADNVYYRWVAREDWEYHTPFNASHYYVPAATYDHGTFYPRHAVVPYRDGENSYYCWSSGRVKELLLASAESFSENRLVRHALYTYSCYDRRMSYIYSVELTQEALSETAYRFWDTMRKNSDDVGGLFSPEPFEMQGNISCQEHPDEVVVGYISASVPAVRRIFIDLEDINFARMSLEDREIYAVQPIEVGKSDWSRYYRAGYAVLNHVPMGDEDDFYWIPLRCVDCTVWGTGSKHKPEFWPNDHK